MRRRDSLDRIMLTAAPFAIRLASSVLEHGVVSASATRTRTSPTCTTLTTTRETSTG